MALSSDERKELMSRYANGPAVLLAAWEAVPPELQKLRPAEDAWSAHEIIVHCADSETFASTRIRLLISDPNPIIVGYDQDEWVHIFRYHDRRIDLALDTIRVVRANTVPVIEAMPEAAWSATGSHTQSGRITADDWLASYGVHLHDHADQIAANVRSLQEAGQ
ncbi:MAG: DinB family protein [Thermomicrobiales bacterium]